MSVVAVFVMVIVCVGCGSQSPPVGVDEKNDNETTTDSPAAADSTEAAIGTDYSIKYEWPEKPKVGSYTLKVNLVDNTDASVEGAEVKVSYDMPSMRGHHAKTETMKQNAKGDYLLPINFAMPGDWEIIVSAYKDGVEIASETILLDI